MKRAQYFPNNMNIVICDYNNNNIYIIDSISDKIIDVFKLDKDIQIKDIKISPDGKKICCLFFSDKIIIFDVLTHDKIETTINDTGCICYSPDGTKILIDDGDKEILVLDSLTLNILLEYKFEYSGEIYEIVYSPDKNSIGFIGFNYGEGYYAAIYDFNNIIYNYTLFKPNRITYSPDSHYMAWGGNYNLIEIWDTKINKIIQKLKVSYEIYCIIFFPNSKHLITSGSCDKIDIWEVSTGIQIKSINIDNDGFNISIKPYISQYDMFKIIHIGCEINYEGD